MSDKTNTVDVEYLTYWKLTPVEKDRLKTDYGISRNKAKYDIDKHTVIPQPVNAEDLDFFPGEFVASFVIYEGQNYPVFLKINDPNEYVDLPIESTPKGDELID